MRGNSGESSKSVATELNLEGKGRRDYYIRVC